MADKIKAALQRPELGIEYVPVNASNRIPLLQNSTIDVECGSTTNTAERQKQVSFSIATYVASPRWLVFGSSRVTEPRELDGQTVVITQGSLNFGVAKKIIDDQKLNVTIVQAKDHAESLLMLGTGRAAAWFEDDILVAGLVANAPDPKAFRMLAATYAPSYYGLMTRRRTRSSRPSSMPQSRKRWRPAHSTGSTSNGSSRRFHRGDRTSSFP